MKRIKSIQQRLASVVRDFDELLDFREDDKILQDELWKAYEALGGVLESLDSAKNRLAID